MKRYFPTMYKKNIFDIPYNKLKKMGITCLIFDLDNTIALIDQEEISKKTKELFKDLEKDFKIVIISNNYKKRVEPYALQINADYVSYAMKPLLKGFRIIKKKYKIKPVEMCMIGDQLVTDILGGNRFGTTTVLVDPLGKKDLKITSFNRFIEDKILKWYSKKGIMMKGNYYE